LLENMSII